MPAHGSADPRPVADAPLAALGDGSVVAKAWLLELVAGRDLQDAAGLPVADFARGAPALCAAVIAALGADAPLARVAELAPGAAALSGARDAAGAVAAIGALRRAAWSCLADALPRGHEALATALALRLGHVTGLVAEGAVAAPGGRPGLRVAEPPAIVEPVGGGSVTAQDARGPEPDAEAPWVVAVEELRRDGRPFTVLLVDVDDLERLLEAHASDVGDALARVERAIRGRLRGGDVLVRERLGRMWVLAEDVGDAAREVAGRVADAAAEAAAPRGVPLTVSIGLASCPGDGETTPELLARADEGVFAARAAGVRLA
jgi:diguanylate cyclase (GGDEF)-like protein